MTIKLLLKKKNIIQYKTFCKSYFKITFPGLEFSIMEHNFLNHRYTSSNPVTASKIHKNQDIYTNFFSEPCLIISIKKKISFIKCLVQYLTCKYSLVINSFPLPFHQITVLLTAVDQTLFLLITLPFPREKSWRHIASTYLIHSTNIHWIASLATFLS